MNSKHKPDLGITVTISPLLAAKLHQMAEIYHLPETEVLKRAIFLMDAALENEKKGNKIAILDKDEHKVGNIKL